MSAALAAVMHGANRPHLPPRHQEVTQHKAAHLLFVQATGVCTDVTSSWPKSMTNDSHSISWEESFCSSCRQRLQTCSNRGQMDTGMYVRTRCASFPSKACSQKAIGSVHPALCTVFKGQQMSCQFAAQACLATCLISASPPDPRRGTPLGLDAAPQGCQTCAILADALLGSCRATWEVCVQDIIYPLTC